MLSSLRPMQKERKEGDRFVNNYKLNYLHRINMTLSHLYEKKTHNFMTKC